MPHMREATKKEVGRLLKLEAMDTQDPLGRLCPETSRLSPRGEGDRGVPSGRRITTEWRPTGGYTSPRLRAYLSQGEPFFGDFGCSLKNTAKKVSEKESKILQHQRTDSRATSIFPPPENDRKRCGEGTGTPEPGGGGLRSPGNASPGEDEVMLTAAPVVYNNSRAAMRLQHQPFNYQVIKDICKIKNYFGRDSEVLRGIIRTTLKSQDLIPADIKDLFRCLLTPSEYDLWESLWKRSLTKLLAELKQSNQNAHDTENNEITLEHLCGEGNWINPANQVRVLTKFVADKVCDVAENIFNQLPTADIQVSYVSINQFPCESFLQFVDRLRLQIQRQVKEPVAQTELLKEMAQRNANEACRRVILSLPINPPPTIADMIEACAQKADLYSVHNKKPDNPRTVAAVTPGMNKPQMSPGQLQHIVCFQCKRSDRWTVVGVDLQDNSQDLAGLDSRYFVIGDTAHTPREIEVAPMTITGDLTHLILLARCPQPPFCVDKGQVIAQVIPVPTEVQVDDKAPGVYWAEVVGENKPIMGCNLTHKSEHLHVEGLIDTGADVTITPEKVWPSHWDLQPVAGKIQGVGGMKLAKIARDIIQIEGPDGFLIEATVERPVQKLSWLDNDPIWVNQWPLSKQKLGALEKLVEEELAKGHIVETTSPWSSPVFLIKKPGKDKWRLLQDLREINKKIQDMGSLQPGMPSPTMLPQDWLLAVVDIKDCFFQIPLHPADAPRFAFSIPTINREAPMKRYHWTVLPQGMKASPFICQWYVGSLLSSVRAEKREAIILHYMDDILICCPNNNILKDTLDLVVKVLTSAGFQLQEDKVQRMPPWKYLGLEITARTVVPQKLEIIGNPKTLADLHSLCGSLNWVRPWLGLTNEDLSPLLNLLKGERELLSPRELTPEAKTVIEKAQKALTERQAHRFKPELPFKFIVLGKLPHLHGLIFQWAEGQRDALLIIEWVFLSHQRPKTITKPQELMAQLIQKARVRLRELAGCDFMCIHLPVRLSGEGKNSPERLTKEMFEHLLQSNANLQLALDSSSGQISVHAPSHKLFHEEFHLIPHEKRSQRPLKALTVFTDASGTSHKSVMTWRNPQTQLWEADVEFVEGSPQIAELAAVVRAFEKFSEPINLVTDSAYVAGVVSRAEQTVLKDIENKHLFRLLSKLIDLVSNREQPFYVMHIRSHTPLPGEIAEGNRKADSLAAPAEKVCLPDVFQQAKISHQQYHQNVPGLIRQFQLTRDQAKAIVATCPNCQLQAVPSLGIGVNPRGLKSCEVWQTDITHIPSFGRLKYVHVSIDTYSGAVYASAHAGEKSVHAKQHLVQAFSVLGIPKEIKTDNGPAYQSKEFLEFVQQWGVEHKTGIPHSPTGQAVIERTHQTLKQVLARQGSEAVWMSPQQKLCKALFTINFLNCSFENMNPPVTRHFNSGDQFKFSQHPPVLIRDPETWQTKGPYELVTWGHGYACVSTPSGPRWIPQKWVKPFVPKNPAPARREEKQVAVASKRRRC
ncbi:PREDICTED: endogenous retrovirus group K member 18 Pol protein-like [Pseudopodoces humilis]|uniref:endogenous retrovirus group K member 18 Pol protein-like n=1 Tax=Pseudopodoces humilis TaxID=181119 RepID=UPI0006B72A65|nr:PREDICTED: endogenous retrovirus group K member 18 Pol protein-like [Pseudopodoces humilis]